MSQNDDLISRSDLKKALTSKDLITWTHEYGDAIPVDWLMSVIDNAPTVDLKDIYQEGHYDGHLEGYTKAINEERPQGECKTCRHRDSEDKKCDCGGLERQGCPFPVNDDYYCKYYEKGGVE